MRRSAGMWPELSREGYAGRMRRGPASPHRPRWRDYALAAVLALAGALATYWFGQATGAAYTMLLPAFIAVTLAAILGGLGPALMTTAIAAVLVFALRAVDQPAGPDALEPERLLIFLLGSLAVGWVAEARRRGSLRERSAHRSLEDAAERMDLMVRAGQVLGSSLDHEETLRGLAELAIPLLGQYCIVDIVGGSGARRIVTAAKGADRAFAEDLRAHPVDPASDHPVAEVLRTGRTGTHRLDDGLSPWVVAGDERPGSQTTVVREAIVVPLRVRDRSLGAITFMLAEPDRHYEDGDVMLAEVLGQRAAKAIENAQLHQEVRRLARAAAERAAEMTSIVAAIGEGILLIDGRGTVRSQNAAATRMLGGTVATVDEMARHLGLDPRTVSASLLEGGLGERQLAGGEGRWLEFTAYRTAGADADSKPGSVLVVRDVTAFRQGQALREAFLGLLSHELRTPVTSIYAAANVLARRSATLDPSTRAEILEDMVGESDRLYRLTEDLLVLARFDEGIELLGEPSLLQRLVPAVVDSERKRWPQTDFAVNIEPSLPAVSGDETSIQQIMRNLLSNAAKYGPPGGRVEVQVEPDADGVVVRVLDAGPGIGAGEVESIFRPFYRSPSTAATATGAGIGLHACKRLIDAMGGRIWARTREGGTGSEVGFWLPRYAVDPS